MSKPINIILWIIQGLLAALFITAGVMKMLQPISQQVTMYLWTGEISPVIVRFLGLVDFIGGVGIILPALLKIKPKLTFLAAIGIVMLMLAAIIFHLSRGEAQVIGFNIVVALLALVVAVGRRKLS